MLRLVLGAGLFLRDSGCPALCAVHLGRDGVLVYLAAERLISGDYEIQGGDHADHVGLCCGCEHHVSVAWGPYEPSPSSQAHLPACSCGWRHAPHQDGCRIRISLVG